jgi:hypothetical protein
MLFSPKAVLFGGKKGKAIFISDFNKAPPNRECVVISAMKLFTRLL